MDRRHLRGLRQIWGHIGANRSSIDKRHFKDFSVTECFIEIFCS